MKVENNVWVLADIAGLMVLIPLIFCVIFVLSLFGFVGFLILLSFPLALLGLFA
jgi:hypothetical protein